MFLQIDQTNGIRQLQRSGLFRRLVLASLLAASGASPIPAAATELLANGEFSDFTIAPWHAEQGSALLSNVDHANNLDSGSALATDPGANGLLALSFQSECVAIQGGATMSSAGFFKAGSKNPSGSKFRIRHFYYGDGSCTGSSAILATPSGVSGYVASPSNWLQSSYQYTAPANAKSMILIIEVKSGVDTSTFELFVDGVSLTSSAGVPTSQLLKDGFEDGSTRSWSSTSQ